MASSFGISVVFLVMGKQGIHLASSMKLVVTVLFTTVCWVATAYLGPATDRETLVNFYRKVKPFGPGWRVVRGEAGLSAEPPTTGENIPLALLGWVAGCATIWSSLFAVGNTLYGRTGYAAVCGVVLVVSGFVLTRVVSRLWQGAAPAP